jgi:hypothetical protein
MNTRYLMDNQYLRSVDNKDRTTIICDRFQLITPTDKAEIDRLSIGIILFEYQNQVSEASEIIQIDPMVEILSKPFLTIAMLNNYNFSVSPIAGALEDFFHCLLFPEDILEMCGGSKMIVKDYDLSTVKIVSTIGNKYE